MQLRRLAVLALVALLAACGDDGPETIDPADARVQIVSGDRQTARVPSPAPQGALAPTAVVGEALLPEPLVVRVVDGAGSISAAISIAGPSAAIVPAGTALHWRVVESGCGSPYGTTTLTDDSAYSVNRVIIGTTARECSVEVGRVLSDGEVVVDSVFRYTLLPGPVDRWSILASGGRIEAAAGDTLDLAPYVLSHARAYDAHNNVIDLAERIADPATDLGWAWYTVSGELPESPTGMGLLVPTPPLDDVEPKCTEKTDGSIVCEHRIGLFLWIDGVRLSHQIVVVIR